MFKTICWELIANGREVFGFSLFMKIDRSVDFYSCSAVKNITFNCWSVIFGSVVRNEHLQGRLLINNRHSTKSGSKFHKSY